MDYSNDRYSLEASPQEDKGHVVQKDLKSEANVSGINRQPGNEQLENKLYDDMPGALPLPFTDSPTSDGYATDTVPSTCSSINLGATEVNTADLSLMSPSPVVSLHPARYPTYHASGICTRCDLISYEACVRLCLNYWDKGCVEAPVFLANECALLRDAFGLKHMLLESREEFLRKDSTDLVYEGASGNTKQTLGKIKIQVHKVRMGVKPSTGRVCSPLDSFAAKFSNVKSIIDTERSLRRDALSPPVTVNGSLLQKSLTNMVFRTHLFAKEVSELAKISSNAWRSIHHSSSHDVVQETYSCHLRLKHSPEVEAVRMQPGSSESRTFYLDGLGELIIEVYDLKGNYCGHASVEMAGIANQSGKKLIPCSIYLGPQRTKVGKIHLYISYSTMSDENHHKCAPAAGTTAFDCVLETAMKVQHFHDRNLLLHASWRWLVNAFSSHYGVSDTYTNLRYLSYIMDVATPTAGCLNLVHDLLLPVVMKGNTNHTLSYQEICVMEGVSAKIEQILSLTFENYKSLDESSRSGIIDTFRPDTGVAAPAVVPALKLYSLLHDIMSPQIQSKLRIYFENAMKMRIRRHFEETDKFISANNQNLLMDSVALSRAYEKMKSLCFDIRNEIFTDIEIHNQYILPSFIDLPKLSSSIYGTELNSRLQAFLASCPPTEPTPFVVELVIATADYQRDLFSWNISCTEGGVDAKELFRPYITQWIEDKRLALLSLCNLEKQVKCSSYPFVFTTVFIDDIYNRLKGTLAEYDAIMSRWPEEYLSMLENAIADVEMAVMKSLEKKYAKVLAPLRKSKMPLNGLKYVQKFTNRDVCPFIVSNELGVFLNSMKSMLSTLQPQIESQVKLWGSCMPKTGNSVPGESLSEVNAIIESKFRDYVQAIIDKLVENTKLRNVTLLKKIIKQAKENEIESDLRRWMKELLSSTIDDQLRRVFETQVFVIVYRDFWDRMGEDVMKFVKKRLENRSRYKFSRNAVTDSPKFQLENKKANKSWYKASRIAVITDSPKFQLENRKANKSWYKASRIAVTVLNDTFASRMQELLGNDLKENDLKPPQSILNLQSMLSIDV